MVFENEDHTLGNLLNEYLQENKNVLYSGLSKPNLVVDTIIIKFETIKNDPLKIFFETIKHLELIFNDIEKKIEKIGGKFINYEKK
jgi:DNA-directed RNA polymerase subunit L